MKQFNIGDKVICSPDHPDRIRDGWSAHYRAWLDGQVGLVVKLHNYMGEDGVQIKVNGVTFAQNSEELEYINVVQEEPVEEDYLTPAQIADIVGAITYKPDWKIHLKDDGDRQYVQIEATTLDSITKQPTTWKSGKNYLSPFMCRQEVVGVVFGAIEKAEIHEMREFFRYRGASIYNPHLDPDVLVEVARKKESFNCRVNAMSMKEGE
jgi:hypothetical protein